MRMVEAIAHKSKLNLPTDEFREIVGLPASSGAS